MRRREAPRRDLLPGASARRIGGFDLARRGAARRGPRHGRARARRKATREGGEGEGRKKGKRRETEREGPESACLTAAWLAARLPLRLVFSLPFSFASFSLSLARSPSRSFPPPLLLSRILARSLVRRLVSSRNKRRRGQWVPCQRAFGQGCHTAPLRTAWKHAVRARRKLPNRPGTTMLVVLSLFLLLGSLDDESDIPRHERARRFFSLSTSAPLPPPLISFTLSLPLSLSF